MAWLPFVVTGLFAAAFSWLSLWLLIPLLSRRLLDQPNARSSHKLPTPRGGGVAFVLVASGFALPFGFALPAALPLITLPLAIVGFLDDRHNLPASLRYGVQVLTALFLLWISPLSANAPGFWVWLLLLIAATAVINFTNFMDGLDGLVAGCMAVVLAVAGLWPLVGALLGFLLWNWSPAKVFMGDVGSTFLGAVFAGVVLQQTSFSAALALLLVATPLLADACLCVPRRLLAGQRIFQAHRLHLFQRLHQAGWCHAHVSSLYIAATVVLAIAHLAGGLAWVIGFALAVLLIGVWLDQHVAVGFAVASKS
ncbi:glycosyltransferase family 4 protein [Synechococcus sp. UW140]|uniref:MraY family glycosyltransferase n=1 Tax=Synechococcus sp. UW140 TaxID=368503 RepID=UPI00313816F4